MTDEAGARETDKAVLIPLSDAPSPLPDDQPYFDMRRSAKGRLSGLIEKISKSVKDLKNVKRERRTYSTCAAGGT